MCLPLLGAFTAKTFDPTPHTPPLKKGIEASESKNPLDANEPKKGGYTTPAPTLDLTTSLRGDFPLPYA